MYVLSFHVGHQLKVKLAEKNISHPSEPGFEFSPSARSRAKAAAVGDEEVSFLVKSGLSKLSSSS